MRDYREAEQGVVYALVASERVADFVNSLVLHGEAAGCTAERIRHLSRKFYRNAPDGLCGNEDHGEMSAWYLFACLGFYPVNPASGEFVLGAPQIPSATLTLADGKTFRIVARGLSEENLYVRSAMLNGRPLDGFLLRHADIARGGELVFEMASRAVFR